jgi:hypothetical protein
MLLLKKFLYGLLLMEAVPPRDLYFYFKGENGKSEVKGPYSFNEEALKQLEADFLLYCTPSGIYGVKKGGFYKCKFDNKDMNLLVKFDEIIYMEQHIE